MNMEDPAADDDDGAVAASDEDEANDDPVRKRTSRHCLSKQWRESASQFPIADEVGVVSVKGSCGSRREGSFA